VLFASSKRPSSHINLTTREERDYVLQSVRCSIPIYSNTIAVGIVMNHRSWSSSTFEASHKLLICNTPLPMWWQRNTITKDASPKRTAPLKPDGGQGRLHACYLHCQQDPRVFLQFLSLRNEHCVREAASQEAHFDICRPNATEFRDCLSGAGPFWTLVYFPHGHTIRSCSFKADQRTMTETMHFEYIWISSKSRRNDVKWARWVTKCYKYCSWNMVYAMG